MIRVEQLQKSFGEVHAVRGVSFEAADGQVTGLLGPNGAGKTTTLRMISTLLGADAGRAWIDDVCVLTHPMEALKRIGILPDTRGLYPRLTTREHLEYFGGLQAMSREQIARRVDELTQLLGLEEIIDRRVAGFSQGQRTKVAIARSIIHDPPNIILDEATNGLDVMSARAVRRVIAQLAEAGRCILFSSHVMAEVTELCDRIIIFRAGEVVADGTAEDLLTSSGALELEQAFLRITGEDE